MSLILIDVSSKLYLNLQFSETEYCWNTQGSYECRCLQGYQRVGPSCIDINQCELYSPCPEDRARLQNLRWFFTNLSKASQSLLQFIRVTWLSVSLSGWFYLSEGRFYKSGQGNLPRYWRVYQGSALLYSWQCNVPKLRRILPVCMRSWLSTISWGSNMWILPSTSYSNHCKGLGCVDINECLKSQCTPGYECKNTEGSFICMCGAGYEYVMSFKQRSMIFTEILRIELLIGL